MGTPDISLWSVITAILLPVLSGAFSLLWISLNKHKDDDAKAHDQMWMVINGLRADLQKYQVECERNFVRTNHLSALEERIDGRLGRIEDKIDNIAERPQSQAKVHA